MPSQALTLELSGHSLFQPPQPPSPRRTQHSHGAKFTNELFKKLHRGRPPKTSAALPKQPPPPPPPLSCVSLNVSPVRCLGEVPSLIHLPRAEGQLRRSISKGVAAPRSLSPSRSFQHFRLSPTCRPPTVGFTLPPPQPPALTAHGLSRSTSDLSESFTADPRPPSGAKARPSSAGEVSSSNSSITGRDCKEEVHVKLPTLTNRAASGTCSRAHSSLPRQDNPLERYKYHLANDAKRSTLKRTPTQFDMEDAKFHLRVVGESTGEPGVIMAPIPSPDIPSTSKGSPESSGTDSDSDTELQELRSNVTMYLKRPGSTPNLNNNANISYSMFNFAKLDGETIVIDGAKEEESTLLPRLDPSANVVSQGKAQARGSAKARHSLTHLDLAATSSQENLSKAENTPRAENSFNARSEYSRNLERNWLKRYTELKEKKRKKKREQKLFKWVKKRTHKDDDFFMAFYSSSEDEDEEGHKHRPERSASSASFSSAGSSNLLRYASLDVLVSDSDHEGNDQLMPDYCTVLKGSQLEEKEVWNKMRKKHRRQHHRYSNILMPEMETMQVDDIGVKLDMMDTLTDKEIRAMRLHLTRRESRPCANDFVLGDHHSIRALAAEILSGLKNLKDPKKAKAKKKKGKKKPKSLTDSDYDRFERRTPLPSLKERFMQDFGHLLSRSRKNLHQESQNSEAEEEESKKTNTETFFQSPNDDQQLLQRLAKPKPKPKDAPSTVSSNDGNSEHEPGVQRAVAETDDEEEDEYGRGLLTRIKVRRNSLPINDKPGVLTYKVKRRRSLTKAERERRKSMKSGSLKSAGERSEGSAQRRDSSAQGVQSRRMSSMSGRGSRPGSALSTTSTAFTYEDVFIDMDPSWERSRPLSARRLCRDETEINLHDLTAGLDFPAKEIKIKIVERKRRRQRKKKKLLKAKLGEERARLLNQPPPSSSDSSNEESVEESSPTPKLPSFLQKKKTLKFSVDSPFVSALLSQQKFSEIRMKYSNEELDGLIAELSQLFLDMKDCRYLRWSPRDWALIQRLLELELLE